MYTFNFNGEGAILMVLLVIWSLLWKCYSVWIAAKRNDKKWFVALVVLNTVGILDMIYVFGVVGKKWSDVRKDIGKVFSYFK
jgi:hypothetical protein